MVGQKFTQGDADRLTALGEVVVAQFEPPADQVEIWNGWPCNEADSQKVRDLRDSTGVTGLSFFMWGFSSQKDGTKNRPDLIGPTAGAGNNETLKKDDPGDWIGSTLADHPDGETKYPVGCYVLESGTVYVCNTDHDPTSDTFADDSAYWDVDASPPEFECRVENDSYAEAIVHNIGQVSFSMGRPDYAFDGQGYEDWFDSETMTYRTFGNMETNKDTVFTFVPYDLRSVGSLGYAVSHNMAFTPDVVFSDTWDTYRYGESIIAGDLVQDRGHEVVNNMDMANPETYYTTSSVGNPATRPDSLHTFATNATLGRVAAQLDGVSDGLRVKEVVDVTDGEIRVVTVRGIVVTNPADGVGRINISTYYMNDSYSNLGNDSEVFLPVAADGEFFFSRSFGPIGSGADEEWTADTTKIRVGCTVNNGETLPAQIDISEIECRKQSQKFKYWRCLTSVTATVDDFETVRAANPTRFYHRPIPVGLRIDYEVSDQRPKNATDDLSGSDNENTVYMFEKIAALTADQGIVPTLYTNDISGFSAVSDNNGIDDTNINELLALTKFSPLIDSANEQGGYLGNVISTLDVLKYSGGVSSGGIRSNYSPKKVALSLSMASPGSRATHPVQAITVTDGVVTIEADGLSFVGLDVLDIVGAIPASLNGKYQIETGVVAGTSVDLKYKVTGVNGMTKAFTTEIVDHAAFESYLGGAVIYKTGTGLEDFRQTLKVLYSRCIMEKDLWRNYSQMSQNEVLAERFSITAMTKAANMVVTVPGHNFVVGDIYLGMVRFRNAGSLTGVVLDIESIDGDDLTFPYDSTVLSDLPSSAVAVAARQELVNEKLAMIAFRNYHAGAVVTI